MKGDKDWLRELLLGGHAKTSYRWHLMHEKVAKRDPLLRCRRRARKYHSNFDWHILVERRTCRIYPAQRNRRPQHFWRGASFERERHSRERLSSDFQCLECYDSFRRPGRTKRPKLMTGVRLLSPSPPCCFMWAACDSDRASVTQRIKREGWKNK